jgi:hypothetical protein
MNLDLGDNVSNKELHDQMNKYRTENKTLTVQEKA